MCKHGIVVELLQYRQYTVDLHVHLQWSAYVLVKIDGAFVTQESVADDEQRAAEKDGRLLHLLGQLKRR